MKRFLIVISIIVLFLSACSNNTQKTHSNNEKVITTDDKQKLKIPKHPKRIVVLAPYYAGGIKYLDGKIVGVSKQIEQSAVLNKQFKDIKKIDERNVEAVVKLKPDLIITSNTDKNLKKLTKIAPTVPIKYDKRDYIAQQKYLGTLLGKEEAVNNWVQKWKAQSQKNSKVIQNEIGNATVSIMEPFNKSYYLYGNNYGHGTEVLYQSLNVKQPKDYPKGVNKTGYAKIQNEDIPHYAGDYILLTSSNVGSIEKSNLWKNMPAYKQNRIIKVDNGIYWFNDPYSLNYQMKDLTTKFKNKGDQV